MVAMKSEIISLLLVTKKNTLNLILSFPSSSDFSKMLDCPYCNSFDFLVRFGLENDMLGGITNYIGSSNR